MSARTDHTSAWDDDATYPPEDWRYEVANGDTRLGYVEWVQHQRESNPETATCVWCQRHIELVDGAWVDPDATGDDSVWREVCDSHDTFVAEHEPSA